MKDPRSGVARHLAGVLGALRAEAVLGARLAARHPIPRSALGWAVGLAALTRILTGAVADAAAGAAVVGLAGLLAAAAGPRLFVRGGPFESLRWVGIPPTLAVAGRLGGMVLFASLGAAAAGFAVAGPAALRPAPLAAAAIHAVAVGALAATLAPAWGCATATVLPVLLVAAGAGAPHAAHVAVAGSLVRLPPPGMLAVGMLDGEGWTTGLRLAVWGGLAALGVAGLGRRAAGSRPAVQ